MAMSLEERRSRSREASVRWRAKDPIGAKLYQREWYRAKCIKFAKEHPELLKGKSLAYTARTRHTNVRNRSVVCLRKRLEAKASRPRPERCEECGSYGRICFDHNHLTNDFRGWLCTQCNMILGFAEDNAATLRKLAVYLEASEPYEKVGYTVQPACVTRAQKEAIAGRPRPGACEQCGRGGKICFDHNHATNKFRGWLCHKCNMILGCANDSPAILRKLAAYLEHPKVSTLSPPQNCAYRFKKPEAYLERHGEGV